MSTVTAYGITAPSQSFEKLAIERRALAPKDVLIRIAFAGICHSDIHTARGEWGSIRLPLVPGHEIAGIIEQVGGEVTKFGLGDRAGVGCFVDACGACENCLIGEDSYCLNGTTLTYNGVDKYGQTTAGGYSTHIVVDEDYVLRIPEGISLDAAAPLLCAGITMYSPLSHWEAGPGKKVGIVGLGGLGHVGVKIAAAMGAEVTIITPLGRQAGRRRRASGQRTSWPAPRTVRSARSRGSLDLIVNTISAGVNAEDYLKLLRLNGSLVNVGIPTTPYSVGFGALAGGRRSLSASGIGGIRETRRCWTSVPPTASAPTSS